MPRLIVPTPGRAAVHPGRRRAARRRSRGCCSPAGATRASTRRVVEYAGRSGCRSRRSRSATTCSPAARWPCWSSSRRSPGCCPACSATTQSAVDDSFAAGTGGLLEAPAYTRPAVLARPGRPAGAAVRRSRARSRVARASAAAQRTAASAGPDLMLSARFAACRGAPVASSWGCPLHAGCRVRQPRSQPPSSGRRDAPTEPLAPNRERERTST